MEGTDPELFIVGDFRPAGIAQPVIGAATERMLGRGPDATFGDIDDAVAAARKAPPGWATTPTPERAQALKRLAGALEARAHAIGELCTRETGAPITSRIANGVVPAALIRYYAALICETDDEEIFRTDVASMG